MQNKKIINDDLLKVLDYNDLKNKVEQFKQTIDLADKFALELEEKTTIKNYSNPFRNYSYEMTRVYEELKKEIIKLLTEVYREKFLPNVSLPSNLIELVQDDFDLTELIEKIKEYIAQVKDLSFTQIKEKARMLLPTIWVNYQRKQIELQDILEGKKLVLKLYVTQSYEDSYYFHHESFEKLNALEKLIEIVTNNTAPETATANYFSNAYWNKRKSEELFIPVNIETKTVEKIRLYKNGRFDIFFHKPEDAQKVAQTLLETEQKSVEQQKE